MAAARSVPSRRERAATRQISATPTRASTVTTRQTSLGMKQACVHVSCAFTFSSAHRAGWEQAGEGLGRETLHAGAIDVNLGFLLFRAPETRARTVFVLTASASVRPAHSAHACYSQVCSGLISAVAVAGQK